MSDKLRTVNPTKFKALVVDAIAAMTNIECKNSFSALVVKGLIGEAKASIELRTSAHFVLKGDVCFMSNVYADFRMGGACTTTLLIPLLLGDKEKLNIILRAIGRGLKKQGIDID